MESGLGDCARISEQLPDQLDNVLRLGGDEQHTDCLKNNNPPPSSCSKQDPETELSEESFFDCQESFDNATQPDKEQELELKDEQEPEMNDEYFKELEKNLSDEEKQSRRDESTKLKEEGNVNFSAGEYCKAEDIYTRALAICPFCYEKEKSILFSNRAAARMKMDKKEDAISDCTKAIELNPNYIRAILRRAELYEQTEKLDEALEDYKVILEKDPSIPQAREACMRLPRQIEERNERLKQEMMSKLKDLGNMFLRPFGLSTENFQVNQDPSTGSYSINFVQNPNNNDR